MPSVTLLKMLFNYFFFFLLLISTSFVSSKCYSSCKRRKCEASVAREALILLNNGAVSKSLLNLFDENLESCKTPYTVNYRASCNMLVQHMNSAPAQYGICPILNDRILPWYSQVAYTVWKYDILLQNSQIVLLQEKYMDKCIHPGKYVPPTNTRTWSEWSETWSETWSEWSSLFKTHGSVIYFYNNLL